MNTQRRGSVRTALAATLSAALATTALAMVPAANATTTVSGPVTAATRDNFPPIPGMTGRNEPTLLTYTSETGATREARIAGGLSYTGFSTECGIPDHATVRDILATAYAVDPDPNQSGDEVLKSAAVDGREEKSSPLIVTGQTGPHSFALADVMTYAEAKREQTYPRDTYSISSSAGTNIRSTNTAPLRAYLSAEQQQRLTQLYTEVSADLQAHLATAAAETTNPDTRAALLAAIPRAATLSNDALNNPALVLDGLQTNVRLRSPNRSEIYGTSSLSVKELRLLGGVIRTTNYRTSVAIQRVDGVASEQITHGQLSATILGLPLRGEERVTDFTDLALDPGGADLSAIKADLERITQTIVQPGLNTNDLGTKGFADSLSGILYVRSLDPSQSAASIAVRTGSPTLFSYQDRDPANGCGDGNNDPPPVETGRITIDTFIPPKSDAGGPLVYRVECRNGYFERVEARGVRGERTSTRTGLIELGTRCTVTPVSNGNWGGETPPSQTTRVSSRLLFRGPVYLPPTGGDGDVFDPRDLGVGVAAAEEEEQRIATTFSEPAPVATAPSSWSDSCPTARDREPVLVIPRLRKCWRVGHEGFGNNALDNGPQRYPGSVDPGRQGVAAIAAHRTTHDSPFYYLDRLREGDKIRLRTMRGTFTYQAVRMNVVKPDVDNALKAQGMQHRLVLTTCSGGLARRLVVKAVLLR